MEATLVFRRAFQFLADERGWDVGEIVMETSQTTLNVVRTQHIYLPTMLR